MRGGIVLLILLLLLAFALGAVLFNRGPSPQYQTEMERLRLDTAAKMRIIKIGFWGSLAAAVVLGIIGVAAALVRAIWRRPDLIRPNASGLFPLVRGRADGQTYYHDPNRQLAGTVAYGHGSDGLEMQQLIPPGAEAEQLQVTTQAQAVQVVAAASQGRGMSRTTRRMVERMTEPRPVPRLPAVVIGLDESIPEERQLLAAIKAEVEENVEMGEA
jgi:hypothetical protein